MSTHSISFNLSQQQNEGIALDAIAMEGVALVHALGLPVEEHLVQRMKNQVTALTETLDTKKLPILQCDANCGWKV